MSRFLAGVFSGVIATAVISIIMALELALGPGSQLSLIEALAEVFARHFGASANLVLGWIAHVVIGIFVWGGVYALLNPQPTSNALSRGLQFGLIVWLLMMAVVMPLAGKGLFGLAEGVLPMLMALVLNLVYGLVLAHYYSQMLDPVRVVPKERLEQNRDSLAGKWQKHMQ